MNALTGFFFSESARPVIYFFTMHDCLLFILNFEMNKSRLRFYKLVDLSKSRILQNLREPVQVSCKTSFNKPNPTQTPRPEVYPYGRACTCKEISCT